MRTTVTVTGATLRWIGLVGVAVVVGACGTTPSTGPAPDGTPVPGTTPGAAAEGTAAPGTVHAGEPGLMPGGDGSALTLVPEELELPAGWGPVPPDGPHFRTQVCGVQLDPDRPVDAAQRRWSYRDAEYLESEVHLFASDDGREAAVAAAAAVTGCGGYGVADDGTETGLGDGDLDVTVTTVPGAPPGWTVWTETTQGTGMVRHIALAPVEGGWHWVSHVDLLGRVGPELLLGALPGTER